MTRADFIHIEHLSHRYPKAHRFALTDASALRRRAVLHGGSAATRGCEDAGNIHLQQEFERDNEVDRSIVHRAFMSAAIALQERAKREGGNAVVDIKSITKHNDLVSATQFRCGVIPRPFVSTS